MDGWKEGRKEGLKPFLRIAYSAQKETAITKDCGSRSGTTESFNVSELCE